MKKIISIFILCFLTLFNVNVFGAVEIKENKIIAAGDATSSPFFYRDGKGNLIGFDIDLMNAISEKLGYKIEFIDKPFTGLIPDLLTGNIDMITTSLSITPERAKKINFSNHYYNAGLGIIVNIKNNAIKNEKDLEGKSIVVKVGTVGDSRASQIKNAKVVQYDNMAEFFLAIETGKVDAGMTDIPPLLFYANGVGKGKTKVLDVKLSDDQYGFGFSKAKPNLLKEINRGLEEVKKDGTYDKIYEKWFGTKK
jgi:polar amino acid transport system substrate-binding protein